MNGGLGRERYGLVVDGGDRERSRRRAARPGPGAAASSSTTTSSRRAGPPVLSKSLPGGDAVAVERDEAGGERGVGGEGGGEVPVGGGHERHALALALDDEPHRRRSAPGRPTGPGGSCASSTSDTG